MSIFSKDFLYNHVLTGYGYAKEHLDEAKKPDSSFSSKIWHTGIGNLERVWVIGSIIGLIEAGVRLGASLFGRVSSSSQENRTSQEERVDQVAVGNLNPSEAAMPDLSQGQRPPLVLTRADVDLFEREQEGQGDSRNFEAVTPFNPDQDAAEPAVLPLADDQSQGKQRLENQSGSDQNVSDVKRHKNQFVGSISPIMGWRSKVYSLNEGEEGKSLLGQASNSRRKKMTQSDSDFDYQRLDNDDDDKKGDSLPKVERGVSSQGDVSNPLLGATLGVAGPVQDQTPVSNQKGPLSRKSGERDSGGAVPSLWIKNVLGVFPQHKGLFGRKGLLNGSEENSDDASNKNDRERGVDSPEARRQSRIGEFLDKLNYKRLNEPDENGSSRSRTPSSSKLKRESILSEDSSSNPMHEKSVNNNKPTVSPVHGQDKGKPPLKRGKSSSLDEEK